MRSTTASPRSRRSTSGSSARSSRKRRSKNGSGRTHVRATCESFRSIPAASLPETRRRPARPYPVRQVIDRAACADAGARIRIHRSYIRQDAQLCRGAGLSELALVPPDPVRRPGCLRALSVARYDDHQFYDIIKHRFDSEGGVKHGLYLYPAAEAANASEAVAEFAA